MTARDTFADVAPFTRKVMQANKGRDTKPEMLVRRLVYSMGFRYRLHRKDLPGKPDLVFVNRRKVIFVHGCFWHAHEGRRRANQPKTRVDFWRSKFGRNRARDQRNLVALKSAGWNVMVVWECGLTDMPGLARGLRAFLIDSNAADGPRHREFPDPIVRQDEPEGHSKKDASADQQVACPTSTIT